MRRRLTLLVVFVTLLTVAGPAGAADPATVTVTVTFDQNANSDNDVCVDLVTWDGMVQTVVSDDNRTSFGLPVTIEISDSQASSFYVFVEDCRDDGFKYYFEEWWVSAPLLRIDRATPLSLLAGEHADVAVELNIVFQDMFGSVFIDDIVWMQRTAITTGCGVGAYCPNDHVTRGQMAAFLKRALQLPAGDGSAVFVDDDASTFEADIEAIATAGITRGCNPPDNDRFCPDDRVTRGQMAAFLVRALGYVNPGTIDFVDDDGSTFEDDIEALAGAGVTIGCNPPDNDRFCPGDPVTRGQMAAFLHRALADRYPVATPAIAGDWRPAGR